MTSNSFLILPVRVLACALDPRQVHATRLVDSFWKWSWNQPDYSGLSANSPSPLSSLWPSLFNAPKQTTPTAERPKAEPAEAAGDVGLPPPLKGASPQPGVCVSWSVPPGWSRLPTRDADLADLPRLPDRWLVVRFARKTHEKSANGAARWATEAPPRTRTWVVDAGVPVDGKKSPDSTSATLLVKGREGAEARRVGAVRDAKDFKDVKDASEARVALHIQGSEHSPDFTFAAFAPSNLNNLSLIDPLDDDYLEGNALETYALSYVVLGWYQHDKKDDPLATLPEDAAKRKKALEALGLDPGAALLDQAPPLGDRCLFHGMVAYVDYFNPSSYLGPAFGGPQSKLAHAGISHDVSPLQPPIGFGVTAEQALARVCAKVSKSSDTSATHSAAEFLEELLTDRLWTLDVLGGSELRRRAETASRFRSVRSGTEWAVVPSRQEKAKVAPADPGEPEKLEPLASVSLTPAQREKLHALNEAQRDLDERAWSLSWEAETLYACWWLLKTEPPAATTAKELHKFIESRRAAILAARSALTTKEALFNTRKGELEALLKKVPDRELVLEEAEAPRFFLPKEPAVALEGVGPRLPTRAPPPLGRKEEGLAARREGADAPPKDASLTLPKDLGDEGLKRSLASLFVEASLVEGWVAELVRHHSETAALKTVEAWTKRTRLVRKALGEAGVEESSTRKALGGALLAKDGTKRVFPGDVCTAWTQQPWAPLFLDWEARWFPDPTADEGVSVQGRTILAHRPQSVIASRSVALQRACAADGDRHANLQKRLTDHAGDIKKAAEADVVAQTLSGIDQQFMARNDAFPRVTPSREDGTFEGLRDLLEQTSLGPLWKKPEEEYRPLAERESFSGMLKDTFYTTRQGTLSIERLWVVDRFGQAYAMGAAGRPGRRPSMAPLHIPRSELYSSTEENKGVKLERRLLEPTRLSVRFEMPEGSTSRVRGWILPNFLDKSLTVYDERCAPLGLIHAVGGVVTWQSLLANAPRTPGEAVKDPALQRFVAGLVAAETSDEGVKKARKNRFTLLLKHIDEALPRTQPAGSQERHSSASLLGRPLALVRAQVRVERKGGPTFDPNWLVGSTFEGLRESFETKLKELAEATESVSVKVGSRYLPDDGVIGYYLDGDDIQRTVKVAPNDAPKLSFKAPGFAPEKPTQIDFLLDPRGKIHLEPDLLPSSAVGLAPEWYEDDLRRLPAVVRVTSVLVSSPDDLSPLRAGETRRIDLPLPVGSTRATTDLSEAPPPPGAPPTPAMEVLFRIQGADLFVDPVSPMPPLPEGEVAAVDGFLIV